MTSQGGSDEVYEVEKVVGRRLSLRMCPLGWEYLIKWKGYDQEFDSWEPASALNNCKESIDEFYTRIGKAEDEYTLDELELPDWDPSVCTKIRYDAIMTARVHWVCRFFSPRYWYKQRLYQLEQMRNSIRRDHETEMWRRQLEDERRASQDELFENRRQRWEAFKAGLTERERAILAAQ